MAKFTDGKGRTWVVEITHGDYLRLKRDTRLDLDQLRAGELSLPELLYGPSWAVVPVLACLLAPQIAERQLTAEEFGDGFPPAVVAEAGDALYEAIFDFFHPRQHGLYPLVLAGLAAIEVSTESAGSLPASSV